MTFSTFVVITEIFFSSSESATSTPPTFLVYVWKSSLIVYSSVWSVSFTQVWVAGSHFSFSIFRGTTLMLMSNTALLTS